MKFFRNNRWMQLSLRTLLILVTVLAIGLGWFASRIARHRELIRSLQADGFVVTCEEPENRLLPRFLRDRVAGEDGFRRITAVHGYQHGEIGAQRLQRLAELGTVRRLQGVPRTPPASR